MWVSVPGKSKRAQVRHARNWQKKMLNGMKNAVEVKMDEQAGELNTTG